MAWGCCRRASSPGTILSTLSRCCDPPLSTCACPSRSFGLDSSAPWRGRSDCWKTASETYLTPPTHRSRSRGAGAYPPIRRSRERASRRRASPLEARLRGAPPGPCRRPGAFTAMAPRGTARRGLPSAHVAEVALADSGEEIVSRWLVIVAAGAAAHAVGAAVHPHDLYAGAPGHGPLPIAPGQAHRAPVPRSDRQGV